MRFRNAILAAALGFAALGGSALALEPGDLEGVWEGKSTIREKGGKVQYEGRGLLTLSAAEGKLQGRIGLAFLILEVSGVSVQGNEVALKVEVEQPYDFAGVVEDGDKMVLGIDNESQEFRLELNKVAETREFSTDDLAGLYRGVTRLNSTTRPVEQDFSLSLQKSPEGLTGTITARRVNAPAESEREGQWTVSKVALDGEVVYIEATDDQGNLGKAFGTFRGSSIQIVFLLPGFGGGEGTISRSVVR